MNFMRNSVIKRLLFLLLLSPASLLARTINWFDADGDVLVDASNQALTSSFVFELGSFGAFAPTTSNFDQWQANWKVFDRAVDGDGWNAGNSFFTSSAVFLEDGTSSFGGSGIFSAGETMYLWVFNSQAVEFGSQWALVRDGSAGVGSPAWLLPSSDPLNPTSVEWDLIEADSVVVGAVNGITGGGEIHAAADPGFVLQLAAVPEPGSAALLLLAFPWLARRRR